MQNILTSWNWFYGSFPLQETYCFGWILLMEPSHFCLIEIKKSQISWKSAPGNRKDMLTKIRFSCEREKVILRVFLKKVVLTYGLPLYIRQVTLRNCFTVPHIGPCRAFSDERKRWQCDLHRCPQESNQTTLGLQKAGTKLENHYCKWWQIDGNSLV